MKDTYILGLNQGTISSRAGVFNGSGDLVASQSLLFGQIYPESGWVEHDPMELWQSLYDAAVIAIDKAHIKPNELLAIGIASQRETVVLWEKKTGKPVYNAIVWQCRRSSEICKEFLAAGCEEEIRAKTGLILDPLFSATKLVWLFREFPNLLARARNGELAFGTVDSWILFNLTGRHLIDTTNASLTMLFNIHDGAWDKDLLKLFGIPECILPEVLPSVANFGLTKKEIFGCEIPVCASCGDQSAALFGHGCFEYGMTKTTYGSGCFTLTNTADKYIESKNNLISTVAWDFGKGYTYALEGSCFGAGSTVHWLREEMRLVVNAPEAERIASKVEDSAGLVMVPAFVGIGAPFWDPDTRASFLGISRGTSKGHFVRAAFESTAYQACDLFSAIEKDLEMKIPFVKVDGGSSENKLLMQFQADILNKAILIPVIPEITALGAAYFAGIGASYWSGVEDLKNKWVRKQDYMPAMDEETRQRLLRRWKKAVEVTRMFKTAF